jgi:hypothetical protein
MAFLRRDRTEPLPSFEEIAASLRADNADLPTLLKQLADKLRADLGPAHVSDNRDATGYEGRKKHAPITEIAVKFGTELTFRLKYENGVIETKASGAPLMNGSQIMANVQRMSLAEWLTGIHETAHALAEERIEDVAVLDEAMTLGLEGLADRPRLAELEAAGAPVGLPAAREVPDQLEL